MFESSYKSQNGVIDGDRTYQTLVTLNNFHQKTSSRGVKCRNRRTIEYSTLFNSFRCISKTLPATNFEMTVKWKLFLHAG